MSLNQAKSRSSHFQEWLSGIPVQKVESTRNEEGRIVLLRPKFISPRLQWLQKRLPRPYFKIKLDERGTCFWEHMDGVRTLAAIAEIQRLAFGEKAEPAEDKAVVFMRELIKGGFAELRQGTTEGTEKTES